MGETYGASAPTEEQLLNPQSSYQRIAGNPGPSKAANSAVYVASRPTEGMLGYQAPSLNTKHSTRDMTSVVRYLSAPKDGENVTPGIDWIPANAPCTVMRQEVMEHMEPQEQDVPKIDVMKQLAKDCHSEAMPVRGREELYTWGLMGRAAAFEEEDVDEQKASLVQEVDLSKRLLKLLHMWGTKSVYILEDKALVMTLYLLIHVDGPWMTLLQVRRFPDDHGLVADEQQWQVGDVVRDMVFRCPSEDNSAMKVKLCTRDTKVLLSVGLHKDGGYMKCDLRQGVSIMEAMAKKLIQPPLDAVREVVSSITSIESRKLKAMSFEQVVACLDNHDGHESLILDEPDEHFEFCPINSPPPHKKAKKGVMDIDAEVDDKKPAFVDHDYREAEAREVGKRAPAYRGRAGEREEGESPKEAETRGPRNEPHGREKRLVLPIHCEGCDGACVGEVRVGWAGSERRSELYLHEGPCRIKGGSSCPHHAAASLKPHMGIRVRCYWVAWKVVQVTYMRDQILHCNGAISGHALHD